jgi:hypothetical protein
MHKIRHKTCRNKMLICSCGVAPKSCSSVARWHACHRFAIPGVGGVPAEIQSKHLLNTEGERYRCTNLMCGYFSHDAGLLNKNGQVHICVNWFHINRLQFASNSVQNTTGISSKHRIIECFGYCHWNICNVTEAKHVTHIQTEFGM